MSAHEPAPGVLAPHLQGWRLHRGLTSMQLAAQAGVSFGAISRAENGGGLHRRTLDTLARVLGIPVEAPHQMRRWPCAPAPVSAAPLARRACAPMSVSPPALSRSSRRSPCGSWLPAACLGKEHSVSRYVIRGGGGLSGMGKGG